MSLKQKFKDEIAHLEAIGKEKGVNGIRDLLVSEQVIGEPQNSETCAVAVFLSKKLGTEGISVNNEKLTLFVAYGTGFEMETPEYLSEFIDEFDNGLFPELEDDLDEEDGYEDEDEDWLDEEDEDDEWYEWEDEDDEDDGETNDDEDF